MTPPSHPARPHLPQVLPPNRPLNTKVIQRQVVTKKISRKQTKKRKMKQMKKGNYHAC